MPGIERATILQTQRGNCKWENSACDSVWRFSSRRAALAAGGEKTLDLRRAVPADVYLAVHTQHDPKRDFQRKYFEEVWNTVQETKIVDRTVKILTSRMSQKNLEEAKDVLTELKEAAKPIPVAEILKCKEAVYGQLMEARAGDTKAPFTSQHLVLLRLTPQAAAQTQEGIKNLFQVAEKYSGGKATVRTSEDGDAVIVGLSLPAEIPFSPTVIRVKDVLLISSLDAFARRSLNMLLHGGSPSKFDDPRLKEASAGSPHRKTASFSTMESSSSPSCGNWASSFAAWLKTISMPNDLPTCSTVSSTNCRPSTSRLPWNTRKETSIAVRRTGRCARREG